MSLKMCIRDRDTVLHIELQTKQNTSCQKTHKQLNKFGLPGVYNLNCSGCNKLYIGQTGRSFKQRYIEHIKALHSTTESTFGNHLTEAGHTFTNINNNMETCTHKKVKNQTQKQTFLNKQKYTVQTHRNNILNEQTQFRSHILFEHITQHTHNDL